LSHDEQTFPTPLPPIGIDLDGTIDESLAFFQWLSHTWPGKVFILTYRADRAKAVRDLLKYRIRYDTLALVSSFAEKAVVIKHEGIRIYFDDQDEMTADIPEDVTVFKIRNGGNFDFDARKWLYSDQTGRRL
jgi:hypothetical protein